MINHNWKCHQGNGESALGNHSNQNGKEQSGNKKFSEGEGRRRQSKEIGIYIVLPKNRAHTHTHRVFKELHYVLLHQATFTGFCGRPWARSSK